MGSHAIHSMLYPGPDISYVEKIVRPMMIYLFLLLAFRFSSKRELAQSTLFDFLVILLIANVVQNAMIGDDNSVFGAFVGTAALLLLSWLLNFSTARSRKLRRVLEGQPTLLVHHGRIIQHHLKRESVALNDLYTGLREQGVLNLAQVRYALLELDGTISVIRNEDSRTYAPDEPGSTLPSDVQHQCRTDAAA